MVKNISKSIQEGINRGELIPFERIWDETPEHEKRSILQQVELYENLVEVRTYRLDKKMTQQDLADISGVGRAAISKIESGQRNITINTLARVAAALGKKVKITFL